MRLFIVGVALLSATSAAAQSRWTLSTGPERRVGEMRAWSARLRVEYDLTKPNRAALAGAQGRAFFLRMTRSAGGQRSSGRT